MVLTEEDIARERNKLRWSKWQEVMNEKAEQDRLALARKQASKMNTGIKSGWEHIGTVPINDFNALKVKYGNECMNDSEFIKWMNNKVLYPENMAATRM